VSGTPRSRKGADRRRMWARSQPFRLTATCRLARASENQGPNLMKRTVTIAAVLAFTTAVAGAAGMDVNAIDKSVPPGTDFWLFANGTSIKAHPIPADRSSYGVGAVMNEQANQRTVELIQQAAKGAKPGSDAQKVGDYYASFMDEAGIEAK